MENTKENIEQLRKEVKDYVELREAVQMCREFNQLVNKIDKNKYGKFIVGIKYSRVFLETALEKMNEGDGRENYNSMIVPIDEGEIHVRQLKCKSTEFVTLGEYEEEIETINLQIIKRNKKIFQWEKEQKEEN